MKFCKNNYFTIIHAPDTNILVNKKIFFWLERPFKVAVNIFVMNILLSISSNVSIRTFKAHNDTMFKTNISFENGIKNTVIEGFHNSFIKGLG